MPANEITREKVHLRYRPDGVVEIRWAPHVAVGLQDALSTIDAITELTGGRAAPVLVYTVDAGPQDRAARTEFIRRHDIVTACALIVGNPLSRMMATFFINVAKPEAPTRLFEDETAALEWVRRYVV